MSERNPISVLVDAYVDASITRMHDLDAKEKSLATEESIAAVRELVEASHEYFIGYCVDEANDTFEGSERGYDTGCTVEQHEAAKRLREALSKFHTADSALSEPQA